MENQSGVLMGYVPWEGKEEGGKEDGVAPCVSPPSQMNRLEDVQVEMLEKARELFQLCDKDEKGFITKVDMQVRGKKFFLCPGRICKVMGGRNRGQYGMPSLLASVHMAYVLFRFLRTRHWHRQLLGTKTPRRASHLQGIPETSGTAIQNFKGMIKIKNVAPVLTNIKHEVDGKSGGEKNKSLFKFKQTQNKTPQKTYTMNDPSASQKKVETTK